MVSMYFPKEEYEARWAKTQESMREKGYQTAVIWGRTAGSYDRAGDILYLTNFYSGHSAHEYDTPLWQGRSYSAVIMQDGGTPELHMDEAGYPEDLIATDRVGLAHGPDQGRDRRAEREEHQRQGRLRRRRHPARQVLGADQGGDAQHRVGGSRRRGARCAPPAEPARARLHARGGRDRDPRHGCADEGVHRRQERGGIGRRGRAGK